ncbi:MAG TPA: hypothetical protein VLY04_01765 [Bryobacteraceae bacterium]|nr:hypothetical protein [Bryobacteraceae bacterium]
MLTRFRMRPAAATGLFALAVNLYAANWTDRGEYDLALSVRAEVSAQKRLALLDQWKTKYPSSSLSQARRELYLSAYHSAGDTAHMIDVVKEMLKEQPNGFVGVYWCSILIPGSTASPEWLGMGEKAAGQLLSGLDHYFEGANKPASMTDADWSKQKDASALLAHRALGWIHWQREELPQAEAEFTAYLKQEPNNAEISSWLGMVLALQKQSQKVPAALWHLARADALRGEGALPEGRRRQITTLLEFVYASYHGGSDGLAELRKAAAEAPAPPANFTVETAAAAAARKAQEEMLRANPELAAWQQLQKRLLEPDGADYFTATLLDKPLPRLKGTLSRSSPAGAPDELLLGMLNPAVEEVVVKLSSPFPNEAPPGTALTFEGVAQSFTRDPFILTVKVDREKVTGWPEK